MPETSDTVIRPRFRNLDPRGLSPSSPTFSREPGLATAENQRTAFALSLPPPVIRMTTGLRFPLG